MPMIGPIYDEAGGLLTIRDPMILPLGDTYYLTGTQPPYWDGENDGVHLWSSKDLKHFTHHGLMIARADMPESMWCRDFFWAPELFDGQDGYYYLTFNSRNKSEKYPHEHNVALARAKEITGPYELLTPDKPLPEPEFGRCNDATMFRDDDGTVWMGCNYLSGHHYLLLFRFDPNTLTLSDAQTVCEIGKEGEWDAAGVEGQCIVKRHGIYFQWYSSWTYGYNAGILTAKSMEGPWEKHPMNPILGDNDIWEKAGHNHCFTGFDGKDYLIFHANPKDANEPQCESMFIVPVEYHADGTVTVKIKD